MYRGLIMSLERKQEITCPNCGQKSEIITWDSLNSELNPKAKMQLLNGSLFSFKCKNCEFESILRYNMLYHDMRNKVMVYLVAPNEIEKAIKSINETESSMLVKLEGYTKRVVCEQNALREKAIIFDNGLDDRVVEIIKLLYLLNIQKQFPEDDITAVYMMIENGEMWLEFYAKNVFTVSFSKEFYENVAKDFETQIASVENDATVINIKWAKEVLNIE